MKVEWDFTRSRLCDTNISDSFPTNITCVLLSGITTFRVFLLSPLCTTLPSVLPMFTTPNSSNSCRFPFTYNFLTITIGFFQIYEPRSTASLMVTNSGLLVMCLKSIGFSVFLQKMLSSTLRRRRISLIFLLRQHPSPLSYKWPKCSSLYSVFKQYRFSPIYRVKFHPYAQDVSNYYRFRDERWLF